MRVNEKTPKMFSWLVIAGVLLFTGSGLATQMYSGYKVLRIEAARDEDLEVLSRDLLNQTQIDVWRFPSSLRRFIDVQLSPVDYELFTAFIDKSKYRFSVLIEDVQKLIDIEKEEQRRSRPTNGFDYGKYYSFEEIQRWINLMVEDHEPNVTLFHVAYSRDQRPVEGLKISTSDSSSYINNAHRPAIFIMGGVHGREWISPATILYMTNEMLRSLKHGTRLAKIVEKFDWYLLPVMNPDGYVMSWTKDRNWAKTRECHKEFIPWFPYSKEECSGVDPDRNWATHWCVVGGSHDKKNEHYCGPSSFSEPVTYGVAKFLRTLNLKLFLDLQSYGQTWMTPWAYSNERSEDYKKQIEGAKTAANAIASLGTTYSYGSKAHVQGLQGGTSIDWVYGVLNVKYSYAVELRDTGKYGFLLPDFQIIRTANETLTGIQALVEFISNDNTTMLADEF